MQARILRPHSITSASTARGCRVVGCAAPTSGTTRRGSRCRASPTASMCSDGLGSAGTRGTPTPPLVRTTLATTTAAQTSACRAERLPAPAAHHRPHPHAWPPRMMSVRAQSSRVRRGGRKPSWCAHGGGVWWDMSARLVRMLCWVLRTHRPPAAFRPSTLPLGQVLKHQIL